MNVRFICILTSVELPKNSHTGESLRYSVVVVYRLYNVRAPYSAS